MPKYFIFDFLSTLSSLLLANEDLAWRHKQSSSLCNVESAKNLCFGLKMSVSALTPGWRWRNVGMNN